MATKVFLDFQRMKRINISTFSLGFKGRDGSTLEATDASFFKTRDESSMGLFKAAINGERSDAVITVEHPGEKFRFKLKQALIEAYSINGTDENFTMKFTTIVLEP